ncbi:MAG: PIN domain-containing protein [Candidatus Micrarchaeota archaeon]
MDYIDSCILWDWSVYGEYSKYIAGAVQGRGACTSVFALLELRFSLVRKGVLKDLAAQYIEKIALKSGITILPGSAQDVLDAFALESCGLQLYDSLHAAICLRNNYRMATADKDFDKVRKLEVFVPPK